MTSSLPASCFCGAVQFKLTAKPMFVNCCHCTECQVQTGSAFAINAVIEAAHVVLTKGKPVRVALPTESGRPHDIYRCAKCQTGLWSDYGRRKVLLFVRVATLKKPIAPDVHIFTRSKVKWLDLPGASARGGTTGKKAKVFKVYYDMKKEWPAASLKRREALMGKGK